MTSYTPSIGVGRSAIGYPTKAFGTLNGRPRCEQCPPCWTFRTGRPAGYSMGGSGSGKLRRLGR